MDSWAPRWEIMSKEGEARKDVWVNRDLTTKCKTRNSNRGRRDLKSTRTHCTLRDSESNRLQEVTYETQGQTWVPTGI